MAVSLNDSIPLNQVIYTLAGRLGSYRGRERLSFSTYSTIDGLLVRRLRRRPGLVVPAPGTYPTSGSPPLQAPFKVHTFHSQISNSVPAIDPMTIPAMPPPDMVLGQVLPLSED
jgi:hypothetical protein